VRSSGAETRVVEPDSGSFINSRCGIISELDLFGRRIRGSWRQFAGSHGDRDNLYDSRLGGAAHIGTPVTDMEGMASIAAREILLYRERQGYIGVTYRIHLTDPLSL